MQKTEPIEYGNIYHIYNRGINGCNLFEENSNYEYFLHLYENHVSPVVETFAWVLMKNHFHFLVRMKNLEEILQNKAAQNFPDLILKKPHQHFSNMFNAYSKAYNKRFKRHGSLFERQFKRKLITNVEYFNQVVTYIHNNPVHHFFVENQADYPWSSFLTDNPDRKIKLQTVPITELFNYDLRNKNEIVAKMNLTEIEKWLGLL
jgi:putative transposase